ncbi:TRAP transporter small permease [Pandoraea nosoerga]|uniref:TRAP transporter small permease protein n=1 Tax=Pandoraea nosoerga TaxID=2508296 RepID=A0A5E4WL36_9BURK|nr:MULTISPECIES: TRAP transporter small permease [Pandoraea]MBN4666918.1 TRAP transporter small permease [Pandoraea nosoerga]MBN4677049.1 TRAP transporter small permease [Pandoraea nosoerga]MBN4681718.1 TRAP transporter small permease [Pandoraea nosoerga]MBN4744944.1 TRAP transporter small permease [Pandoraea nosoerga]VVE25201.1 C4-dicarboxylate ABC transporter [Pandoraea nosoerga]
MSGADVRAVPAAARSRTLRRLDALLQGVSRLLMVVCMFALVGAALVLSYSVFARHVLKLATDWQDEAAVFMLVGATFVSAAHVQHLRGHIGIEAITTLLSARVNRVRRWLVDIATLAFCAFFAWKSWTLFWEAYVDGQTSSSTWGPPLAIPYGLMAFGMTLLTMQLLVQVAIGACEMRGAEAAGGAAHAGAPVGPGRTGGHA